MRTHNTLDVMARTADLGRPARDRFLDLIRAVAVVRVVTWHAYGWAPITWVISAVPAMVFVSGHLTAASLSRRAAGSVLRDRLRRLLIPFWTFGLVAWAVMAGARILEGTPETALSWRSVPLWILPLNDPVGSVWESGWLSQPLWYLRVLLWLLLLAPALWWLARRLPAITVAALAAVTVALEVALDSTAWRPAWAPDLLWRAGDITLYAGFFVVGMAQFDGRLTPRHRRAWLGVAVAAVAVAVAWSTWRWPQDGIVNNSHVVHGAMGAAWLAVAYAARPVLETAMTYRPIAAAVDAIGRRSLTIYLWHSAAVIVTWHVLVEVAPLPRGVHNLALAAGTLAVTALAVVLTGWVEDLAAGRSARAGRSSPATATVGRPAPTRPSSPWVVRAGGVTVLAAGVAVIALAAAITVPDDDTAAAPLASSVAEPGATATPAPRPAAPRIPSQGPRPPAAAGTDASSSPRSATDSTRPTGPVATDTGTGAVALVTGRLDPQAAALRRPASDPWLPAAAAAPDPELADALRDTVDTWLADWQLTGIRIALGRAGSFAWHHTAGTDWAGAPLALTGTFDIESITKTVTATAVWQLAERGTIDLDAPIDEVPGVPNWPAGTYTVRQLLEHRTTIPGYGIAVDATSMPRDPVAAAITGALDAEPLAIPAYSSTNYLVLGKIIEAVTGAPLDHVLAAAVLGPAGIDHRFARAPATASAPGGGAAGLVTDLDGLLSWGDALLRRQTPLSVDSWWAMRSLDPVTSMGAGLYGYCPCTYDGWGDLTWSRLGHSGGTTSLEYDEASDIVFALQLPDGVWEGNDVALDYLLDDLARLIADHEGRR